MLVTFTYAKDKRPPTVEEMNNDIRNLLKKLRKELKGIASLKYIYVKEVGKKGAHHIHMIMDICDMQILKNAGEKDMLTLSHLTVTTIIHE